MAGYFNIFHILIITILLIISALLVFVSSRQADKRFLISFIVINFVVTIILGVFLMFAVDKYTKKAVVENIAQKRVLINETIVFKGVVKNIGAFSIANCNLTIKLINEPLNKENLKGDMIFKPSGLSLISWFKFKGGDERPNTVEHKISIAKNLKSREFRNFSVSIPYPSYFTKTNFITKLGCY